MPEHTKLQTGQLVRQTAVDADGRARASYSFDLGPAGTVTVSVDLDPSQLGRHDVDFLDRIGRTFDSFAGVRRSMLFNDAIMANLRDTLRDLGMEVPDDG